MWLLLQQLTGPSDINTHTSKHNRSRTPRARAGVAALLLLLLLLLVVLVVVVAQVVLELVVAALMCCGVV